MLLVCIQFLANIDKKLVGAPLRVLPHPPGNPRSAADELINLISYQIKYIEVCVCVCVCARALVSCFSTWMHSIMKMIFYHPNIKRITANPIAPPATWRTVGLVVKGDNFLLYKTAIGIKAMWLRQNFTWRKKQHNQKERNNIIRKHSDRSSISTQTNLTGQYDRRS